MKLAYFIITLVLLIVICLYGWFLAERVNNWPPLPRICPIKPCFYQDFEEDIPEQYRKISIRMYYLWICTYYTAPITLCSFHVRWCCPYLVFTFLTCFVSTFCKLQNFKCFKNCPQKASFTSNNNHCSLVCHEYLQIFIPIIWVGC